MYLSISLHPGWLSALWTLLTLPLQPTRHASLNLSRLLLAISPCEYLLFRERFFWTLSGKSYPLQFLSLTAPSRKLRWFIPCPPTRGRASRAQGPPLLHPQPGTLGSPRVAAGGEYIRLALGSGGQVEPLIAPRGAHGLLQRVWKLQPQGVTPAPTSFYFL